jgi:hypothetical protein
LGINRSIALLDEKKVCGFVVKIVKIFFNSNFLDTTLR